VIPQIVNSVGLVCDIVGAVLIWRFGLPADIDRRGRGWLLLESKDEAEIRKGRTYDRWSMCGFILLVLGFLMQLASNWIPRR
jgi:hypothetical protein